MASWADLERELDRWAALRRRATFWWRDDDAVAPTPELERLLGLAAERQMPLCLAIIPRPAGGALAKRLHAAPGLAVAQHGFAHRNHALPARKRSELGSERPIGRRLEELRLGLQKLHRLFGPAVVPMLVPPWNRIDASLVPHLAGVGYHILSAYGPRLPAGAEPGLAFLDSHCDPVHWRADRGFIGFDTALGMICGHLQARRRGTVAEMPTGLLTHHLVMDAATWQFTERLLAVIRDHPAAAWIEVGAVATTTGRQRAAAAE